MQTSAPRNGLHRKGNIITKSRLLTGAVGALTIDKKTKALGLRKRTCNVPGVL